MTPAEERRRLAILKSALSTLPSWQKAETDPVRALQALQEASGDQATTP